VTSRGARLPRRLVVALVVAAALATPTAAAALATPTVAAAHTTPIAPARVIRAVTSYLRSAQDADGGFGEAPGQPPDQLYSGWAALGLAAAGQNLDDVTHGGPSVIGYIETAPGATSDVGSLERTILVLGAARQSPQSFDGRNLVTTLEGRIQRDGAVSGQVNLTTFAVLALRSAAVAAPARTLRWLAAQQDRDGGFSYSARGGGSDVDDTGAVLEALAGDRAAAAVRARAVTYLRRRQDRDGGFPSTPGEGSNAQSTAWAIQGLEADRVSVVQLHDHGSPSPLAYLESLVRGNGLVDYSRGLDLTPVWVSGEALMALAGKPLPVRSPPLARSANSSPQNPSWWRNR